MIRPNRGKKGFSNQKKTSGAENAKSRGRESLSPAAKARIRDRIHIEAAKRRQKIIGRAKHLHLDKGVLIEKERLGLGDSLQERDIVLHQLQKRILKYMTPMEWNRAETNLFDFLARLTKFEERLAKASKFGMEEEEALRLYDGGIEICKLMLHFKKILRKKNKKSEKRWRENLKGLKEKKAELKQDYKDNPSPRKDIEKENLYYIASQASEYVDALKPACSEFTRIAFNQADWNARKVFMEEKL